MWKWNWNWKYKDKEGQMGRSKPKGEKVKRRISKKKERKKKRMDKIKYQIFLSSGILNCIWFLISGEYSMLLYNLQVHFASKW